MCYKHRVTLIWHVYLVHNGSLSFALAGVSRSKGKGSDPLASAGVGWAAGGMGLNRGGELRREIPRKIPTPLCLHGNVPKWISDHAALSNLSSLHSVSVLPPPFFDRYFTPLWCRSVNSGGPSYLCWRPWGEARNWVKSSELSERRGTHSPKRFGGFVFFSPPYKSSSLAF